MIEQTPSDTKETEILTEIRDAEKKAEDILEKAKAESQLFLQEASKNSSHLLSKGQEDAAKSMEKKISDFREKLRFLKEENIAKANEAIRDLKANAQKNIPQAVGLVMEKFEESM